MAGEAPKDLAPPGTWVVVVTNTLLLPAVVLVVLYVFQARRYTTELLWGLVTTASVVAPPLLTLLSVLVYRQCRPIHEWLARRRDGAATPAELLACDSAVAALPRNLFVITATLWLLGSAAAALAMSLRFAAFTSIDFVVVVAAATSGGVLETIALFFVVKHRLIPIRRALAAERGPERRAERRVELSLSTKLLVSFVSSVVAIVFFAGLMATAIATRAAEGLALLTHQGVLREAAAALEERDGGGDLPREPTLRVELLLLDASTLAVVRGEAQALTPYEIAAIGESGPRDGDSSGFDSPAAFTWTRLPNESGILVAVTPASMLSAAVADTRFAFLVLLVISLGVVVVIALLLARDIRLPARELIHGAQQIAAGDLRTPPVAESDDEIGELARVFYQMAHALRGMVENLARGADRVEETARETVAAARTVATASAEQARDLDQITASLEAIDQEGREVARSAEDLQRSVEETAASAVEVAAAADQLRGTAAQLSSSVSDTSGTMEESLRNITQIADHTDGLLHAASGMSSGVEQMVASMRLVESNASEAEHLAKRVVERAEDGQAKVADTISGMGEIRSSAESVQGVLQEFVSSVAEIGRITGIIEDVGDESGLLALNAAIIAAQTGESGRAFAVVADEMKALADRVLSNASEIGKRMEKVDRDSRAATTAIGGATSLVARGARLSEDAGAVLEAITEAARESTSRMLGIVSSVREQSAAASHAADLMVRIRDLIEQIRGACREQREANQVIVRATEAVDGAAHGLHGSAAEQARAAARIGEGATQVGAFAETVSEKLRGQIAALQRGVEFMERVRDRALANQDHAKQMDTAMVNLVGQAAELREGVRSFRF